MGGADSVLDVLVVRGARSEDLPVIERIVDRAYGGYVERMGRKPAPMLHDYAQKLCETTVLVAEEDEVIGVLVLVAEEDHLLIENVAVEPSSQARGVGRALLDVAERQAAELGLGELRLYTNAAMTENLVFYPRLGYLQVDRRTEKGFDRIYFAKPAPEPLRIETTRLLLRPMRIGDTQAMHRVFADPCVMRYVPGGSRDAAGTEARLRSLIDHQHTHGFSKWAVVTKDGEVLGDCGLQYLEGGPEMELGFHVARAHWGHGYATEAASAWLTWARTHRLEHVVAIVDPENTRSRRVLEKIGMRYARAGTYFGRSWDVWIPG
jgi:RimJ/RimL family protein N-acetyltransferase/predicted N-acetyltransferase YhbS